MIVKCIYLNTHIQYLPVFQWLLVVLFPSWLKRERLNVIHLHINLVLEETEKYECLPANYLLLNWRTGYSLSSQFPIGHADARIRGH